MKEIGHYALGFTRAGYNDRYQNGMYHSFDPAFRIGHDGNEAAGEYVALHKLTVKMMRAAQKKEGV